MPERIRKMINIIFDMDGVIFDSESVCLRCWNDYAEKYGLKETKKLFRQTLGTTIEKTKQIMQEHMPEDFSYEEFRKDTSARFHEIEAQEGLPVKKGARELLAWLKENGAHIGLASSTRTQTVIKQLTHAGLTDYFDVIVGGDMAEKSKPEPDIYLETCKRMKIKPGDTYGIEDSFNGIKSLHKAGLHPIMVPDMLEPDEQMYKLCEKIFDDLIEVREYLKKL